MKEFIKGVFSDGGSPSASRVLTGIHSLVSCAAFLHVTIHNHAIPDAVTMTGLGAFASVHYAINAARNALQKNGQ